MLKLWVKMQLRLAVSIQVYQASKQRNVRSITRRNLRSIALTESEVDLQNCERSIARHVQSSAVTEDTIGGAGL